MTGVDESPSPRFGDELLSFGAKNVLNLDRWSSGAGVWVWACSGGVTDSLDARSVLVFAGSAWLDDVGGSFMTWAYIE